MTVPSPALQRGPNGYYAYVVKSDGTAEKLRQLAFEEREMPAAFTANYRQR